jgi:uncharacterized membrane protein
MALTAIKISKRRKQRHLIILTVINIIPIICGLGFLIAVVTVWEQTSFLKKTQFEKILRALALSVFLVILICVSGLRGCYNCANPSM